MDTETILRIMTVIVTALILCFDGRTMINEIMKGGQLNGVPPFMVYVVLFSVIYFVVRLLLIIGIMFLK